MKDSFPGEKRSDKSRREINVYALHLKLHLYYKDIAVINQYIIALSRIDLEYS